MLRHFDCWPIIRDYSLSVLVVDRTTVNTPYYHLGLELEVLPADLTCSREIIPFSETALEELRRVLSNLSLATR